MKKFATIAIAFVAMAGWASEARAGLLLEVSTDNGATYTQLCADGSPTGSCSFSGTIPGTGVLATGLAAVTVQGASISFAASSTADLINTGGTVPVWLRLTSTDFTSPTGSTELLSHIGDTVTIGSAANLLSYTSCVSTTNNNNCTTSAPVLTPNITAIGSASSDSSVLIPNLSAPFAINELIQFTLGAGTVVNYSASSSLTPVPEPATTALFGLGLLGVARKMRRRFGSRA